MNNKDSDRITIIADVARYLADGGTIQRIDHTANHAHHQPIKRTRTEQIKYCKRMAVIRGGHRT